MNAPLAVPLLGPFEVRQGEQAVSLGGPRIQALFTVLVLHRGSAVSAERIIDDVRGEAADGGSRRSLHTHVSTLRHRLAQTGTDASIVTDAVSHRLKSCGMTSDLDTFERGARTAVIDSLRSAARLVPDSGCRR